MLFPALRLNELDFIQNLIESENYMNWLTKVFLDHVMVNLRKVSREPGHHA